MKKLFTLFSFSLALVAQESANNVTITFPAGTYQPPITVQPPLTMSGNTISCPGCGGGNGGNGGGALFPWNPPIVTPPTIASGAWTFLDSVGGSNKADVTGGVQISSVGPSGYQGYGLAGLYTATPGTAGSAFTVTAHMSAFCQLAPSVNGGPRYGLFFGDTGGKIVDWQYGDIGGGPLGRFTVSNWTSPTSPVSVSYVGPQMTTLQDMWWRMSYDGTNFKYFISPTGADTPSWTQLTSIAANANLASPPAKVGFEVYPQWQNAGCNVTVGHWSVTQP